MLTHWLAITNFMLLNVANDYFNSRNKPAFIFIVKTDMNESIDIYHLTQPYGVPTVYYNTLLKASFFFRMLSDNDVFPLSRIDSIPED